MLRRCSASDSFPVACRPLAVAVVVCLGCSGVAAAQDLAGHATAGVRRITLQQAQQLAAGANNPLVRLGELQVEAAKQHRLGVKSMYFPSVSTQFENLHLNTPPGEVLTIPRPFRGTTLSVPVNIIEQDQTAINVSVVQPITPLLAIRQLVKVARADENIARAKAGMPVAEYASLVEKNYLDLMIAQRELVSADADAKTVAFRRDVDSLDAARSWLLAESTVKTLTASLDEMLGLPAGTRLELVPPDPLVEDLSLADAVSGAAGSAGVVEAEQTAVKARAGSTLAKMEYFPAIGIIGGYTHQHAINAVLPHDFAYVGVMLTYSLFDSGKREHGVKEADAQLQAADLAAQLTKAKAASAVKSSYEELERSREFYQLARRMVLPAGIVRASYVSGDAGMDPSQAKLEAELFRAELEYRQAYAQVKSLVGGH